MKSLMEFLCTLMGIVIAIPAFAAPFSFSTGNPDGLMATASRPSSNGKIEMESADDFVLSSSTLINHVTFTGIVTPGATIDQVRAEIYRVFPEDSNVGRTAGPPVFSTSAVPTRVNSPSDVAFQERDNTSGLSFAITTLNNSFTTNNSVVAGGIHPKPNQTTGGNGPVTGKEIRFDVTLAKPFSLPSDHYFFVPQVQVSGGEFLWLSAPKPIVAPGTSFIPDLQEWIRDENLAPDWLRVGTDIVGGNPAHTFNASFSLEGTTAAAPVPEPSAFLLFGAGLASLGFIRKRFSKYH